MSASLHAYKCARELPLLAGRMEQWRPMGLLRMGQGRVLHLAEQVREVGSAAVSAQTLK
jgi:hypothetical protein